MVITIIPHAVPKMTITNDLVEKCLPYLLTIVSVASSVAIFILCNGCMYIYTVAIVTFLDQHLGMIYDINFAHIDKSIKCMLNIIFRSYRYL